MLSRIRELKWSEGVMAIFFLSNFQTENDSKDFVIVIFLRVCF